MRKNFLIFVIFGFFFATVFYLAKNFHFLNFDFLRASLVFSDKENRVVQNDAGSIEDAEEILKEELPAGKESIVSDSDNFSENFPEKENKEFNLEEIGEELDDISEKIDVLAQEVSELLPEKERDFLKEKSEKNKDEDEEEKAEDLKEIEVADEAKEPKEKSDDSFGEADKNLEQKLCVIQPGIFPERNKAVINEIAWMGSVSDPNNEWIELKNISGIGINISGWQIISQDGKIKIIFGENDRIPAGGFYLLERTNDETLPGLSADKIYTGALENSGENLYFFDANCQLQDAIIASFGWPAGDNSSKRTIERRPDFSWQTSSNPGGTPEWENSAGYYEYAGGMAAVSPLVTLSYLKILISEIQIAGKDSEGKKLEKEDFVELYNPNNADVDLTDWYIQRKTKNATSFSSYVSRNLLSGKTIKSKDYFLTANASSSFFADATTTNPLTEDNVLVLKNPEGDIVDKVGFGLAQDFEGAPTINPEDGQSMGRIWSTAAESYIDNDDNQSDFEVKIPTPGAENQSFLPTNQLPIASFIFFPEAPFVGEEVLFDASSSTDPDGKIEKFLWDFGEDFATTSQATTSYSFATSGDFAVNLSVVDNSGATSVEATATISVKEKPEEENAPILSVVINEIAWMGISAASSADEWIELKNNTGEDINLNNWTIFWSHGTSTHSVVFSNSTVVATTAISAYSFYLLERTDDIFSADLIYTGALNNSGAKMELFDENMKLIDEVDCSRDSAGDCGGWFAGNNDTKQTMERINSLAFGSDQNNWASSTNSGGTPKEKNSAASF